MLNDKNYRDLSEEVYDIDSKKMFKIKKEGELIFATQSRKWTQFYNKSLSEGRFKRAFAYIILLLHSEYNHQLHGEGVLNCNGLCTQSNKDVIRLMSERICD